MTFDNLFLASKSPRRRELVTEIFKNVDILDIEGEEPRWEKGQSAAKYLEHCVEAKWEGALKSFLKIPSPPPRSGILVADTIVVLGKEVLGKPTSIKDAAEMLQKLSNQTHTVLTRFGLGLLLNGQVAEVKFSQVETKVSFAKLSQREIKSYVASKEPMDKAGAYGFQDRALRFVTKIEGSYLNVVGLPVDAVGALAREVGFRFE